jgi:hypothetical protein
MRFPPLLGALIGASLLLACNSDAESGDGQGGSGGQGGAEASHDATSEGGAAGLGPIACTDDPPQFPSFDRACWDATWCVVAFHRVDCCGTRLATSMLHTELERFDPAEAICDAQYPDCRCAAGPTQTDSGQTAVDESTIKVECRSGVCTSFVP